MHVVINMCVCARVYVHIYKTRLLYLVLQEVLTESRCVVDIRSTWHRRDTCGHEAHSPVRGQMGTVSAREGPGAVGRSQAPAAPPRPGPEGMASLCPPSVYPV